MDNFAEALAAVKGITREGVVSQYAIGGAMALTFWAEPAATFDLDVFVLLPPSGIIVSLEPIYTWARRHGYEEVAEHVVVAGVPIQFIPAPDELAEEAIATAADLDYDGEPIRVIRPEYLIAMYLQPGARTRKRLERAGALLDEEGLVDRALLRDLLERYELEPPRSWGLDRAT
jgi:hypothetical protein